MNTAQVDCFLAVARALSFTDAAKELFMAQPALSKQIATLEQELGFRLFDRTRRQVKLTPAGEAMFGDMREMRIMLLQSIDRARAISRGQRGSINAGIIRGDVRPEAIIRAVNEIASTHPSLDINLENYEGGELRRGLKTGRYDVVITADFDIVDMEKGVKTETIEETETCFALGICHRLTKKPDLTYEDLKEETFLTVAPREADKAYAILRETCISCGFTPEKVRLAPNYETLILWIVSGKGVGVIARREDSDYSRGIRFVSLPHKIGKKMVAVWKADNENALIPMFVEVFKKAMRETSSLPDMQEPVNKE